MYETELINLAHRMYQNGAVRTIPQEELIEYLKKNKERILETQKQFPLFHPEDVVFIDIAFADEVDMSFINKVLKEASLDFEKWKRYYEKEISYEIIFQSVFQSLKNRTDFTSEITLISEKIFSSAIQLSLDRAHFNGDTDITNLSVIYALNVSVFTPGAMAMVTGNISV